jgi:alpha-glucosidase
MLTHYGDGKNNLALAKLSAALMLTLEGSPYLYYGEEIGMQDYAVQSFDEVRDMVSVVYRDMALAEGKTEIEIVEALGTFSRDRCRTPMQWGNGANAGFSPEDIKTWLPVHENYRDGVNVAEQEKDEASLLHLYRKLLSLRKENPVLIDGKYRLVDEDQNDYLAYLRENDSQSCLVLLNFDEKPATIHYSVESAQVLFSSAGHTNTINTAGLELGAFEILILILQAE